MMLTYRETCTPWLMSSFLFQVVNERKQTTKVWSSKYHASASKKPEWGLAEVIDALADMYILAEATLLVANPASSFSGCIRDIRTAMGHALSSTQVGIPPHDDFSLKGRWRVHGKVDSGKPSKK